MSADTHHIPEEIQDAAAIWLARRDRGLSAKEQDAYLEWLYENPQHGRAVVQLERVWSTLNKLEQWRPAHSAIPNPDLLAPRRLSRMYWLSTSLAAAAAAAMAFYVWLPSRSGEQPMHHEAIIHPGPERQTLADGSVVELNQGAKIDVQFRADERHVRLVTGEAHFTVAKNPARPFFVDTGRVSVRAVGTAFSVALATNEVSVLVTEGSVAVLEQAAGRGDAKESAGGHPVLNARPIALLGASQRTVVRLTPVTPNIPDAPAAPVAPTVQDLTPADIERALSWQALRLEFVNMPLGDVVAAFNRYNRAKLVVADAETAAILVGGNFRADNADAFVRLLDAGFGVSGFRIGDEITLRKTR